MKSVLESPRSRFLPLLCVLVMLLSSSCTTMRPVSYQSGSVPTELKVGDQVRIETRENGWQSFKLTGIDNNGLLSEHGHWPYSDILQIEVQRVDGMRTALIALPVLVLAAVAGGGGGYGGGGGGGGGNGIDY